jgi:alkanesulfonate monooxygenase SsuD/methylene tetrahydromethanopterin reductase-like flavin-dependent oxidoreductase (luciferase family)
MKLLMTRDGARFDGEYYRLRGATYNPKPVQKPHPPLWIGASGERLMLPIVGRYADAWHAFGRPDDLRRKARIVDEHAEKSGRDPSSILHASALSISEDWDEVTRTAVALRDAGFGYLTVSWPAEGRARVDQFLATVAPEISG